MTAGPPPGIRLRGGAPIPPAPSLGRHCPVNAAGVRLGAAVETQPGHWIPVCGQEDCRLALAPRDALRPAAEALYGHWGYQHPGAAA